VEKSQRNLELIEKAIHEDGWQPGYDYYLMDCYFGLHQYEKALQHAKSFLTGDCFAYGGDSHVYHMILECMRAMKLPDAEMLRWAEEAGQKHPTLPEFYAEQGMILCGLGRLSEARRKLIEALLHHEQHTADIRQQSYFSPEVAAKVAARLGEIAMYYDDVDEAALWFKQAMAYSDSDEKVVAKVKKFLDWAKNKGIMP
jgi:tetratricopeptide (TPR) repeat protein